MDVERYGTLWNLAAVKIWDTRRVEVKRRVSSPSSPMPTNFFLVSIRGEALIRLDGTEYRAGSRFVLHGPKGSGLAVRTRDFDFDYYVIYYKATLPILHKNDWPDAREPIALFRSSYGFETRDPALLLEHADRMHEQWRSATALGRLNAKTLFYRLVSEVLRQMQDETPLSKVSLSLAAQAVRYLEEHYAEPITLDSLATLLNCSVGHLSRLFKQEFNDSPMRYLAELRLIRSRTLLVQTDLSLQNVTTGVGFVDKYHFGRLFKKHAGMSPIRYRHWARAALQQQDPTFTMRNTSIVSPIPLRYIEDEDNEIHSQYESRGSYMNNRSLQKPWLLAAVIGMLLLTACSGSSSTSPSSTPEATASASPASSGNTEVAAESGTRVVDTVKGPVEIPAHPERIAALDYLPTLILLGADPTISVDIQLRNPYIAEFVSAIQSVGEYNSISLEKLLELNPDVIIASSEKNYEQYAKIAPTIIIPYAHYATPHEELRGIGQLLGKEAEAEAWLADFDRRAKAAYSLAHDVIKPEETVSLFEMTDKELWVYGSNYGRGGWALYEILGLSPPAKIEAEIFSEEYHFKNISLETMEPFAGDYIFLTDESRSAGDSTIFQSLDAVKNGRVFLQSYDEYYYYDPLSIIEQAEKLAERLVEYAEQGSGQP